MNGHTHSFSATTNSSGIHEHDIRTKIAWTYNTSVGRDGCLARSPNNGTEEVKWGSDNGFGALTAGAHTHTVSGTTGSNSSNTSTLAQFKTGEASGNTENSSVLTTRSKYW